MLNAVSVDVEEWQDTVLFYKSDELRGLRTDLPGILYFHTWEMARKAPPVLSWKLAVQFSNLSSVRGKVKRLLSGFSFSTAREALGARP